MTFSEINIQLGLGRTPIKLYWFLLTHLFILSLQISAQTQQDDEQAYILPSHRHVHRHLRDAEGCKPVVYRNTTHSKHPAASGTSSRSLVETHYRLVELGTSSWDKRPTTVLHQVVNSPLNTLSILEPGHPGSCQNGTDGRSLVRETAVRNDCIVAINAGLFDTQTGACLGNIISDGFLVQSSGGIINAHFVGGAIWLVKDGVSYVDESLKVECEDTQETGTLERFASVVSARTAIGHDAEGRVHLVEVNGKTGQRGVDLYTLANLLIEMGIVNAINLDGGGSATAVINGTLVNYPSDKCANSSYNCERAVTTVVCIHTPRCQPRDCSGHGSCDMGMCRCRGLWTGPACDKLKCPADCSWHGVCTEVGKCIANVEINKQSLVPSTEDQSSMWLTAVLCLSILGVSSLLVNAMLSLTLARSQRRHQAELKRAARLAAKHALQRAARGNARRNSENDDEDDDLEDEERGDQFIEERLSSSSNENSPAHVSDSTHAKKTGPVKPHRRFPFPNFLSLKSVRLKDSLPNAAKGREGEMETTNEQLFPLLTQGQNGKREVWRGEDTSSEPEEEDLFIAPQKKHEGSINST
ncbi:N-acetylglucosamine-1-phosphodiester alpha-n-acetylglucosaminidase-like [Plakobranchus ocellatus]|uniref:N-acetylglucosamine-1-phosphodiester alpha-n-acetylglucosaminidase-like n=1 Tax=Plakobranchus ocellatus TaxID=259542 RepID=A0AAV4BMF1_9GAST|nr:N-acetylglucosamine-1-phosphodiester alpha-n-acetylglucosaminidase-like [Plakobranchus ocellatus]